MQAIFLTSPKIVILVVIADIFLISRTLLIFFKKKS